MSRLGRAALAALVLAGAVAGPAAAAAAAAAGPDGTQCAPAVDEAYQQLPWAQRRLAPQRAWTLTRGGSVRVAVLDTGVSRSAAALDGRVLPGRDVLTGGPADSDCSGHGTFVAGLIAARQVGRSPFSGVAPDALILPIRVSDQAGDVHPDVLAKGIQAAVDDGATVIAVAATAPFGSPSLLSAVVLADRRGALVVAAAATMRGEQGDVAYPAALPGVISVVGIGPDGRPQSAQTAGTPTLAAPGTSLVSIPPAGQGNIQGSGVNLAVGFVAGAAALIRAYLPALSPAAVRQRLTATSDPGPASAAALGSGVVDPVAAVSAVLPAAGEQPPAAPRPEPVVLPPAPAVDNRPTRAAAAWAGGVLLTAVCVCVIGVVLVRGRQRGWRTD
jgi:membrane-anchored mycosin MYCP